MFRIEIECIESVAKM
jgi:hypothetical protein